MSRPRRTLGALLPCSLLFLGAFASAAADPVVRATVAIEPAPLDSALNSLARQSGVQILFASELARGKRAPAVQGEFTAREALERLLAGQGLEAVERSAGVYLVRKVSAPPRARRGPAQAPAQASPAQHDAEVELEMVIVTGEKTRRDLQSTTTSVAITNARRIEEENIQDLDDVLNRTANASQGGLPGNFNLRGISNVGSGGQAPLSTIYVDGAALPNPTYDSAPLATWDVEQVEVLRGPQSTIQGQNALAGAIVLRTNAPTMWWDWNARAQFADPDDRTLAFAGGGPLVADQLAFRVSVEDRDSDGFIHNTTRDAPEDALSQTTARAKLLWTPQAIDALSATLSYTWYDRSGPFKQTYVDTTVPDFFSERVSRSNYENVTDNRTHTTSLELDYGLSDRWSLASVSAWSSSKVHSRFDRDRTALDLGRDDERRDFQTRTQELRLGFRGERLEGLVGLYGSWRDGDYRHDNLVNTVTPTATIAAMLRAGGLPAAMATQVANLYTQALPNVPVAYDGESGEYSRNRAVFADGALRLTPRLHALAGLRYDEEEYSSDSGIGTRFIGTYPDPAAFGAPGSALHQAVAAINQGVAALVAQAGQGGSIPRSTRSFKAWLPRLGVRYDWTGDLSTGLVVQRGYRSGGSSYNAVRSRHLAYDPEYTTNYEASLRSSWLEDRLRLNANLFYTDWRDKQVTVELSDVTYDSNVFNAGKAHLYGFEVEAAHRINPRIDWYLSVGHVRTRHDDFDEVPDALHLENYEGQQFLYAPHWTAGAGVNVRLAGRWLANLNGNFRDRVLANYGAVPVEIGSRTLLNAKVAYRAPRWSVYVFAQNLLDRRYVHYRWSTTSGAASLGDPRVVGVGFEARQ